MIMYKDGRDTASKYFDSCISIVGKKKKKLLAWAV